VPASRPAFHYALLASIALHALLLFAFPDWIDTARRVVELPAPLIARLLQPEPAPAPPAPEEQRPAPVPEKKVVRPKPAPAVAERKSATPTASGPAPDPSPPQAEPVPAPPPVAAVAPPAPAATPPAAAKVEDTTPQTADQYRVQLIEAARLIKDRTRYPPQAWENHWEGDVVLGIALRPDGKHSVVVKRSSRYDVLDRQAVQILGQALREVPLPPALRGKDLALRDVTVQYRQRD